MSKIQVRRGTAAQWTAANPILASGEIGFETDTGKIKVGNGSAAWGSLPNTTEITTVDGNSTTIQVRHETSAGWEIANPTLAYGEIGYEFGVGIKIGNGSTSWNNLDYPADRRRTEAIGGTSRTLVGTGDNNNFFVCTSSSTVTLTLAPEPSTVGAVQIQAEASGTGKVVIAAGAGVTIRSALSPVETTARYQVLTMRRTDINEWVVY